MGYQFETMSQDRLETFLAAPRNATIGATRKSGAPHLSPVWYLYESGKFHFPLLIESVKYRILKGEPRVSICIDGGFPDIRAVMVDGNADLIEDPREPEMFCHICRRYFETHEEVLQGAEAFHQWGKAAIATVTPTKIRTQDFDGWERTTET